MIWLSCVIVLLCVTIAFLVTEIGYRGILIERLEFEIKQTRSLHSAQTRQVEKAVDLVKKLQKFLNDVAMRLDIEWRSDVTFRHDGRDFLIGDLHQLEILESCLKEFCHKVLTKSYEKEDKGLNA
jgi:hypothetical protein